MAKQNQVDRWASSAKGAQFNFLPSVVWALDQFSHGNRLPLTKMIALANGKVWKGENGKSQACNGVKLTGFAGPIRNILAKAMSDAKLSFKDGKAVWTVGENGGVNSDVVRNLETLLNFWGKNVLHAGHKAFKEAFPSPDPAPKATDDKAKNDAKAAVLKRVDAEAERFGMTREAFIAFLMAKDDLPLAA